MRDWWFGTKDGEWVSMSVYSDGTHYGAPNDIYFSFPVTIDAQGHYKIVDGLSMDDWSKEQFNISGEELKEERAAALETCK
ncbi:unnamed protein product [Rodentolepis nana]|nr:unnamed protein product [Rodentolepis nana]